MTSTIHGNVLYQLLDGSLSADQSGVKRLTDPTVRAVVTASGDPGDSDRAVVIYLRDASNRPVTHRPEVTLSIQNYGERLLTAGAYGALLAITANKLWKATADAEGRIGLV